MALAFRKADQALTTRGQILTDRSADEVRAILKALLIQVRDRKQRLLCWNTTFDCAWAMAYELEQEALDCRWLDGMMLWKVVDNEPTHATDKKTRSYGLKKYVDTFTNRGGYQHGVDYHSREPANLATLLRYNKDDCKETLLAAETLWAQLTPRQQAHAITEAAAIPLVAGANLRGLRVDLEAAQMLDAKLDLIRAHLHADMAKLGVTEDQVRSPKKLSTLLFKKWGLPILKENEPTKAEVKKALLEDREPRREPSTDKEVLHELAVDFPNVEKLGKWREAMNLRTKFVTSVRESCAYNGEGDVTHPQGIMLGTYTTRMTYNSKQGRGQAMRQTGFALHQMKRGADFRGMVLPPIGYDLVEFDAAGQEFRWMAIESGDVVMLSLCEDGEDAHSYMAAQIDRSDYRALLARVAVAEPAADKLRKGGKLANLSLQYRTSRRKLRVVSKVQYGMDMTDDQAAVVWSTYRRTYVGVPMYWKRQVQLAKEQGYIENLAGSRVQLLGDWSKGAPSAYPQEQTAINYPIQSIGGAQKYLALRVLRDHLHRFDAHFAMDLHDGLFFYVPKDKSLAFAVEMRKLLGALPYREAWGLKPPVPLPFDCKRGSSWGALKAVAG